MTHIQQFVGSSSGGISASAYTTQNKSADFTAVAGFLYLIDSTSATVTVTLPSANVSGQTFAVKWLAGANTVTLNRAGSDTIGPSATTATMGLAMEVWEFVSSGSGQWNLVGGNKTLTSLDGRYAGGAWQPSKQGLKTWTFDPQIAVASSTGAAAGTINLGRLTLPVADSITNLVMYAATGGSALTSGQCFAALYTSAGARIGVTADQAAAWATSGLKVMALVGGPFACAAADYYIGWWANGTTPPAMVRNGFAGGLNNVGLTAPNLRYATADAGVTTTAPPTLGTQSSSALAWWMALS